MKNMTMNSQSQVLSLNHSSSVLRCADLSELDKKLLNNYQHGLPDSLTPYADMAGELGVSEGEVIGALQRLTTAGVISRVGAVFRPKRIGSSTLAAMAVPSDRLQEVARQVSSYVAVNHNYERKHEYNLWVVVTAADEQALNNVLEDIPDNCGYPVLSLPMLEDYHIDLGFEVQWEKQ